MTEVAVFAVALAPSVDLPAVVRRVIGAALKRDPDALEISRRCRRCGHPTHGKPEVVGADGFSYSVSHTTGWAVVAYAWGTQVGVDIEAVRPRRYLDRLAARVLTPAEHREWAARPTAEQLTAFLQHWTAREAYAKATGVGVARGVRDALAGAEGWTIEPIEGLDRSQVVGTVAAEGGARVAPTRFAPVP